MAISNREIIMMEQATHNITEDLHTFAKWKSLGYIVKKGEKALVETRLWKYSQKKNVEESEEETVNGRCYLAKAFLFGEHQVEKIKKEKKDD